MFIESYYTNLLAHLHTKIPLKLTAVITVTSYFHPNYTESECYSGPLLQPWRRGWATEQRVRNAGASTALCSVSQLCPPGGRASVSPFTSKVKPDLGAAGHMWHSCCCCTQQRKAVKRTGSRVRQPCEWEAQLYHLLPGHGSVGQVNKSP